MLINEEEFLRELADHIKAKYKSIPKAAEAWGTTRSYVYAVVAGNKPANKMILRDVGYIRTKVSLYEPMQ